MFEFLAKKCLSFTTKFIDTHIHGAISDVQYWFANGNFTKAFTVDYISRNEIGKTLQRESCRFFQENECWIKLDGIKECFAENVRLEENLTIEPSLAYYSSTCVHSAPSVVPMLVLNASMFVLTAFALHCLVTIVPSITEEDGDEPAFDEALDEILDSYVETNLSTDDESEEDAISLVRKFW